MTNRKKPVPGLAPRHAALWLLTRILDEDMPLDRALEAGLAKDGPLTRLADRDRAFARTMLMTCLRHLGQIDALLKAFQERPLPRRAGPTRHILRLGTAQILFLGTAPHAAVASAMELATRDRNARHFKNLVNALLRRTAREGAETLATLGDAGRLNTPDWLWAGWEAYYGAAQAQAIATAHLAEPPLDFSLRDHSTQSNYAVSLDAAPLPFGGLRRNGGGAVATLSGFEAGDWWVQDFAASLPARLLGDVKGMRVLDLCAAPGGKTAQLCAAGAEVTALDRAAGRIARLSGNLARLGLTAETVTADATEWRPAQPFTHILLDAPCSATGTIRRHPDIPWRKSRNEIATLTALQDRLLAAAADMLAPGGVLVYCTCSLEPQEGEERIANFLANRTDFTRRPLTATEFPGFDAVEQAITENGDLRTLPCLWPDRGGMDGFYAARLSRSGQP